MPIRGARQRGVAACGIVVVLLVGCSLETGPAPYGPRVGGGLGDVTSGAGGMPSVPAGQTGTGGLAMVGAGNGGGSGDGAGDPSNVAPGSGGAPAPLPDAGVPTGGGATLTCDAAGVCPPCPAGGCDFTCMAVNPLECRGQCPGGGCVQICQTGPTGCALECPGGDTLLCPVCTNPAGCAYGCGGPRPIDVGCWGGN